MKQQVQVSRRISPEALTARQEELLYAAEHGAVLVSPCISPGEKAITREQCLELNAWAQAVVEAL